MRYLQAFSVVIVAYVLAHGLTAWLITPLQSKLLPAVTAFASLVYLPHGVRVLSTWLLGWWAFVPLFVGAFLAEVLFSPTDLDAIAQGVILWSVAVGALSSPVAFELMRLAGYDLYAGRSFRVDWRWLLLVGVIASVLNSVGQVIVFSGEILPGHSLAVVMTYAVGDLVGLVVTTLFLMLVFRWLRLSSGRGQG